LARSEEGICLLHAVEDAGHPVSYLLLEAIGNLIATE
jgi:hypothetical protein